MALLQIESGDKKGKRVRLPDRPVIVGRGDSADLRIRSGEISREHCRLTGDGDEILVVDLGSSNGTFANGRPISGETRLAPGDRITFGPITLRVMGVKKKASKPNEPADSKMVDPAVLEKARSVSEDDVSNWLTDDVADQSGEHEDTTILRGAAAKAVQSQAQSTRTFDSVAEEAADIFRRHYESLKQV